MLSSRSLMSEFRELQRTWFGIETRMQRLYASCYGAASEGDLSRLREIKSNARLAVINHESLAISKRLAFRLVL